MSALVLSALETRGLLQARYPFAQIQVFDADYNVPTEEAVEVYKRELTQHLFDLYGGKWQEYFDCDNFSLEAICLAYRKHWVARQAGKGNAQGVAFGLLCFRTVPADLRTGHCICFRIDRNRNIIEWEPQNRLNTPLTPEQCATVWFAFLS